MLVGTGCYLASLAWAGIELPPDRVPMHFDASGSPTWFGTRTQFLGAGAVFGGIMIALGVGCHLLVTRGSLGTVNVPHKEYWVHPDRIARLRRMLATDMGWTFGVTLLFLSVVPLSAVHALTRRPPELPAGPVWVVVTVSVVGTAGWCVWLARYRYRPK